MKLIVFDMDGVLVDARELHYEALNRALTHLSPNHYITREAHLSSFDGLPTSKKLKKLTDEYGLNPDIHNSVWEMKQKSTIEIVRQNFTVDYEKREMLRTLKDLGYTVAVASNSIRETIKMMLLKTGLLEYVDFYISNQDVRNPKPSSEMYLQCMIKAGVDPVDTLIVEDSHVGRTAAKNSGATLCPVRDTGDVTLDRIQKYLNLSHKKNDIKWQGGDMNIIIPMAGAGTRFQKAGYTFPKPLIEVNGKPMIQLVVENLNIEGRHIFIVQKEHYEKYNLKHLLSLISPGCEVVQVESVTEGAACTTLLAKEFINSDEPLLIANSDQYVEWNSNEFMYSMTGDTIDAGILTFTATHPKWSFAKLDEDGFVCEVAEKKPISDIATAGIYYWSRGSDYVRYAEQMIEKDIRVNNEFYVCPVFNEAIGDGKRVKRYQIEKMWGLGTPEDLDTFIKR